MKISEATLCNNQLRSGDNDNSESNKEGEDGKGNGDGDKGAKAAAATANCDKHSVQRTTQQSNKVMEMTRAETTRTVKGRAKARSRVCNYAQLG
jgi:hypothetical protein